MARSKVQQMKDEQRKGQSDKRHQLQRYFVENGFNKGNGKYNGIHRDIENVRGDTRSIEDAEWASIQHIEREDRAHEQYLAREAKFRDALNSPHVQACIQRAIDWRKDNPEPWQVMQSAWLYVRKNYPNDKLAANICKQAMFNATLIPPSSKVRR